MPIGRIQPPNLDDRTWEQIVEEMKKRIPNVAPEWTDHNPSDPGITMIELFAYIAEMVIYRLNQVPDKNYIEFLNLLDITRDPPTPATVELTFELSDDNVVVPKGTQVSTVPNEHEDVVVFETNEEKILTKDNNKTWATNALTIKQPEVIGYGTGETYQVYSLKNAPLYPEPNKPNPFSHLEIRVDDKVWTRVDEFTEGQNEHYRCNPVTGEIIFGDGKLGGIPAHDAEIIATSYRYVSGGSQGNVPADSITLLKSPILGIKSVINPQSASGGSDWEDIEDTKRRAPQQIKSRYRAVTKEDYEFLAKESTNEVAKVRCLGPKKKVGGGYMDDPIDRNPGKVNLIIVPQIYYNPADDNTRKPMPPDDLINEIKTFLEPRCMLTSELILNKPIYVEIGVEEAVVYIRPGEDKKKMEEKIKNDLIQFFHPVSGSYASKGWEIGEDVYLPQVFDTINRHSEISYIEKLAVKRIDKPSANGVRIEIEEYELVCAAKSKDFKIKIKVEEQDIT